MEYSFQARLAAKVIRRVKFILLPIKSVYIKYLNLSARRNYHAWAVHNERACFVDNGVKTEQKVSIVVPAFNTDSDHFLGMVYSVINQHYDNWELIIVNASSEPASIDKINNCTDLDTRIKIVGAKENISISSNTNIGIAPAEGDFIAFLDHDDLLHPCALHALMNEQALTDADIIYSDEDKVTHDGSRYYGPHCKPGWSPHLMENVNYINHLTVIRAKLVRKVNGLNDDCNGAQDYDLLHRIIDICNARVSNVAKILYHWRSAETSTARDISTKTYIFEAGKTTLTRHLKRKNINASVKVLGDKPGFYKIEYKSADPISLIVGPVDVFLRPACVNWLKELILDHENPIEIIIEDWFKPYEKILDATIITCLPQKDFLNHASRIAKYDNVIVFKEAAVPIEKEYLYELAAVAKGINSIVQPIIVGSDQTIIDAGLVESKYGLQPLFKGLKYGDNTFFGNTDWVRDIARVSESIYAGHKSDIRKIHSKQKDDLSHVVWAHTVFETRSYLQSNKNLKGFNSQLTQSMFEVRMVATTWDEQKDRSE